MTIRRFMLLLAMTWPAALLPGAEPSDRESPSSKPPTSNLLTIGSPAPPLDLGLLLKGEPVPERAPGVVYVVEFSGTQCAPCIRCIPHLTALQKKYPKVVFISVYSEPEAGVREFMAKHGDQMGFRVALDGPGSATYRKWMTAAGLQGIPYAFVVGPTGNFDWIGSPFDLEEPLGRLLEGKLDAEPARIRLRFDQAEFAAHVAFEKWSERYDEAEARLAELIDGKRWPEAVAAAEQMARDFPAMAFNAHESKLYALAINPATTDRAVEFAATMSAETRLAVADSDRRAWSRDASIAQGLLHPENNDRRLQEAALVLLERAEFRWSKMPDDDDRLSTRIQIDQVRALLHAERKEFEAAAARIREVLTLERGRTFTARPGEDQERQRELWESNRRKRIAQTEQQLAKYTQATANGP